jgi:nucleoside 2-deoxyribosyltransferase
MMKKAFLQIKKSDIVIAELSYKSIGIGLELGFAKAKRKKIIYLHKKGNPLSTTVFGINDIHYEYSDLDNLLKEFDNNPKFYKLLSS